jgi:predicted ATP-dependent endonuclease of OLD family
MTIKTIEIKNLLSFDNVVIKDLHDINCIVGKNNVGKSNLLKIVKFFYEKMEGKRVLAPKLNSNYSPVGEVSIEYETTKIKKIVMSGRNKDKKFFNIIYSSIIKDDSLGFFEVISPKFKNQPSSYKLSLKINSDGSSEWVEKDKTKIGIIKYLFPFLYIDSRHIDLHDWDKLWNLLSSIKSFNIEKVEVDKYHEFIDKSLSKKEKIFTEYITLIEKSVTIEPYRHKDKVLSFLKAGLKGGKFNSDGEKTEYQSDGTNSFNYIDTTLKLLMLIARKEYITPFIYIDEPEVGLHPKKCELLINNLYDAHLESGFSSTGIAYKNSFPQIFVSTHSPNIVKEVIRKFESNHQVIHFSKEENGNTEIQKMNSQYKENNFLSIFSDNEARLFFSDFIFFVEGETELELFGNLKLQSHFKVLKQVDIYQCANNKLAEGINPSYSNTSIPYLFLYDADKFYEFSVMNNSPRTPLKIKFCNPTKLLGIKLDVINQSLKYYKRGYNKKHKALHSKLEKIKTFSEREFQTDRTGFFFKKKSSFYTFRGILKDYIKTKNVVLLNDTIEGALISQSSREIFYKWLLYEHNINLSSLRQRIQGNTHINDDLLLNCIKLMFDGKSDTQFKYSNKTKKNKYNRVIRALYFVKGKQYWPTIDKTCGWVTSFINFSVDEIKKEASSTENETFDTVFARYFPEIYGIIIRLYPDR